MSHQEYFDFPDIINVIMINKEGSQVKTIITTLILSSILFACPSFASNTCKDGDCDQSKYENPTCKGGKCDQRGSVNPTCNGGGC